MTTLKRTKVLYLPSGEPANHRVTLEDGKTGWATNAKPLFVQRGPGLPSNISTKAGAHFTASFTDAELERAHATAKKFDWQLVERSANIVITPPDRWAHLDGDLDCDKDLLDALELVARDLDETILVRSGRRTMDEQWSLFNANMHYVGGMWVPKPGHALTAYPNANAPHVRGVAADCGINGINIGAFPGARTSMLKHDVALNVVSENWHCQLGGRAFWAPNWLPKGA